MNLKVLCVGLQNSFVGENACIWNESIRANTKWRSANTTGTSDCYQRRYFWATELEMSYELWNKERNSFVKYLLRIGDQAEDISKSLGGGGGCVTVVFRSSLVEKRNFGFWFKTNNIPYKSNQIKILSRKVIPRKILWFLENVAPELGNVGQLCKLQSYFVFVVLVAVVRRVEGSFHWINYSTWDNSIDFDETIFTVKWAMIIAVTNAI